MERNPYLQATKYIVISGIGAFFVTAVIANLLGSHFEAAIIFNWLCAAHILTSDKTNTYHYVFIIAFSLLIGGLVFATALAPLWFYTEAAIMLAGEEVQLQQLHPYYMLTINALVSSAYVLTGYRKIGSNPAEDFM